MEYSHKAGMAKKAPIARFAPATADLPTRKFDAICARHVLHDTAHQDHLLDEITKAIRPEGHLLISDFAAGPGFQGDGAPVILEKLVDRLEQLRFDVRIAEETTQALRRLVIKGWADLAARLEGNALDPDEARAMEKELVLWRDRLAGFASGALQVIRVHAIKAAD